MSLYHRLNDWIRAHEKVPQPHPFGLMCLIYKLWCAPNGHHSSARIDFRRWQRVRCTGSSVSSLVRPGDLGRISVPMRRDERYGYRYSVIWDDGRRTLSPASLLEAAPDSGCGKDPRTMTQAELEAIPISRFGWPCEPEIKDDAIWFTHTSGQRYAIFLIGTHVERVAITFKGADA